MNIVAIIQARMTSSRLPGKVLADIEGVPMLGRVVERVRRSRLVFSVVVASTDRREDDPVAAWCASAGVVVFRGSETDVLGRFVGAAARAGADVIIRITADCPLLDALVLDRTIEELVDHPGTDYASNVIERSYPRGLDVEVFTREALARMDRLGGSAASREHVTVPVRLEHPNAFMVRHVRHPVDDSDLRWTVDTSEDLEFVRLVYRALGLGERPVRHPAIVAWCRSNERWARRDEPAHTWDPSREGSAPTTGEIR